MSSHDEIRRLLGLPLREELAAEKFITDFAPPPCPECEGDAQVAPPLTIVPLEEKPELGSLYPRYRVQKSSGEPVDDRSYYFVLRLDSYGDDEPHVKACRAAAWTYAKIVEGTHLEQIGNDLAAKLEELEAVPFPQGYGAGHGWAAHEYAYMEAMLQETFEELLPWCAQDPARNLADRDRSVVEKVMFTLRKKMKGDLDGTRQRGKVPPKDQGAGDGKGNSD